MQITDYAKVRFKNLHSPKAISNKDFRTSPQIADLLLRYSLKESSE
jgi:hypothetical protein